MLSSFPFHDMSILMIFSKWALIRFVKDHSAIIEMDHLHSSMCYSKAALSKSSLILTNTPSSSARSSTYPRHGQTGNARLVWTDGRVCHALRFVWTGGTRTNIKWHVFVILASRRDLMTRQQNFSEKVRGFPLHLNGLDLFILPYVWRDAVSLWEISVLFSTEVKKNDLWNKK